MAAYTRRVLAAVIDRTGVTVIARTDSCLVSAPTVGQAGIDSAGITVVAREVSKSNAVALHTTVARRAVVLVITILSVRRENTAQIGVAGIVRARITVLT